MSARIEKPIDASANHEGFREPDGTEPYIERRKAAIRLTLGWCFTSSQIKEELRELCCH